MDVEGDKFIFDLKWKSEKILTEEGSTIRE
jgi:hypothetical protein